MVRAIETHRLRPPIDSKVYRFGEVAEAIRAIPAGRHFGKICVEF
jgi:NADPH:quinone reductase-like Zn-dependent oxidoreductase